MGNVGDTYDVLDRLSTISYPTGTATTFTYDGQPTPTPQEAGELTKITDESGTTSYSHDSMGRLVSKTVVIGTRTFTVGYSWGGSGSALDKLTAITYPSGSRVNYSYDLYGSVSAITVNPVNPNGQGVSGTPMTLLSAIGYNAENKVTGWLWSDGKARTIGYDSNGLVSSYNLGDPLGAGSTAGLLRSIQRDAAGRITGYTHTNNGTAQTNLDQSFGYDNLDRLTSQTQATSTTGYSYDATGNRTAKTVGGSSYSHTVSATSNRLTQVQDPTGAASIGYDAAGNTVGDGSTSYGYGDRGRMASATTGSGTVSYLYNGLGQRVKKSGPTALVVTGASHFVYDEAGQLLGEYDAAGAPIYETLYLAGTPVGAMKQTGAAATGDIAVTIYNVHADQIDTPRVITRQDETIVWRWDAAEAFGATAPDQNPAGLGVFSFNQRFPGQVFDAETGLFQNWNREYSARIGRYVQSDPIGLAGGINTFAYTENSPQTRTDPKGLTWESNAKFFRDWWFEQGDTKRSYAPGSTESKELQTSAAADYMRSEMKKNSCRDIQKAGYSTAQGAWDTGIRPWTWGSTAFQLGGFVFSAVNIGDCKVRYRVYNTASLYSFFYHLPGVPHRARGASSTFPWGGNIEQFFEWTETSPCGCTCS